MEVWKEFVACAFSVPCPDHPDDTIRFFCPRTHTTFCESCHAPDTKTIRVYRNMYHNVIRVRYKNYAKIQTFIGNGQHVAHLKPFKPLNTAGMYEHHCSCGRGIDKSVVFCSIECLVSKAQKKCVHNRKGLPVRSPVS